MPITIHQFIDDYPVHATDRRMICGTIHPHQITNFNIPFFYGNIGSLWNILGESFPRRNFQTLESIIEVLTNHQTWVTDIIRQCEREHEGITEDDKLYNIIHNGEQISNALIESEIDTIYFTSRFGRNNATKIFCDALNINYRETYNANMSEFTIPVHRFGREIRCIVLYSPSGSANIGILKAQPYLQNIQHYRQFPNPVKQFKIEFYRNKFDYLND